MNSKYTIEELREISRECKRAERKYYSLKAINAIVVFISFVCSLYLIHLCYVRPLGRYFVRIPFVFLAVVIGISLWLMYFVPKIHFLWDKVKEYRLKKDTTLGIHRATIPPKE